MVGVDPFGLAAAGDLMPEIPAVRPKITENKTLIPDT